MGAEKLERPGSPGHSLARAPASGRQEAGESLGDFAYRVMREAIRSGKIRPGEHLREADVANWLNISRTPVREAFHRIISEGLLTNGPWNGVMLADLDAQQLVQLYAVREVLEGAAAALAAKHATKAEIQLLLRIAAAEASEKHNPEKLVVINGELHQTLYGAAHNPYLLQSLNSIVDTLGLLRHSTFVLPGSIELGASRAPQDHPRGSRPQVGGSGEIRPRARPPCARHAARREAGARGRFYALIGAAEPAPRISIR